MGRGNSGIGKGAGAGAFSNLSSSELSWLKERGATKKQLSELNKVVGNLKKGTTVQGMDVSYENVRIVNDNGRFKVVADSYITQDQKNRKGKLEKVKRPLGGFSHIV